MARAMTKSEFTSAARKAGVNPNIYGLIIDHPLIVKGGIPSGGCLRNAKVIGIKWFDEWKTEEKYRPGWGTYDETFLSKEPYVVMKKGRDIYYACTYSINEYLQKLLNECLNSKVKAQKERKKN